MMFLSCVRLSSHANMCVQRYINLYRPEELVSQFVCILGWINVNTTWIKFNHFRHVKNHRNAFIYALNWITNMNYDSVCVCAVESMLNSRSAKPQTHKHPWQKAPWNRLRTQKVNECVCARESFTASPKMLMVAIKFLMLPILLASILHKMRVFDHTNTRTDAHLLTYLVSMPFWHYKSNNKRYRQTAAFRSQHLIISPLERRSLFSLLLFRTHFRFSKCTYPHISCI